MYKRKCSVHILPHYFSIYAKRRKNHMWTRIESVSSNSINRYLTDEHIRPIVKCHIFGKGYKTYRGKLAGWGSGENRSQAKTGHLWKQVSQVIPKSFMKTG